MTGFFIGLFIGFLAGFTTAALLRVSSKAEDAAQQQYLYEIEKRKHHDL